MKLETMNSAIFVLKTWGIESTLEYPGYIQIYRERADGSGHNVRQELCFGDVNPLFGASVVECDYRGVHSESYIETDLSSDCDESGRVARAVYEAIFGPMDIDTLKRFAQRAKPLNPDEWGSDRQTDAQNGFGYLLKELLPTKAWEHFEDFALKATEDEMTAYGIKLAENKDAVQVLDARIEKTLEAASDAFWAKVAEAFPEAKHGDFGPEESFAIENAMRDAISMWVRWNVGIPGGSDPRREN